MLFHEAFVSFVATNGFHLLSILYKQQPGKMHNKREREFAKRSAQIIFKIMCVKEKKILNFETINKEMSIFTEIKKMLI